MIHRKVLFKYEYFYQFYTDMELLVQNAKSYYRADSKHMRAVDVLWNGFSNILISKGHMNEIEKYRFYQQEESNKQDDLLPGIITKKPIKSNAKTNRSRLKRRHSKSSTELQLSKKCRIIPYFEPVHQPLAITNNTLTDCISLAKKTFNLKEAVVMLDRINVASEIQKIQIRNNQTISPNHNSHAKSAQSSYSFRQKTINRPKAKKIKERQLKLMTKEPFHKCIRSATQLSVLLY